MFVDFLLAVSKDTPSTVLDLNCLYSADIQEARLHDALPENPDSMLVIKYKTKPQTKYPAGLCGTVIENSDFVVSFDLFSTHPEVKKNRDEAFLQPLLKAWEVSVERMNKL